MQNIQSAYAGLQRTALNCGATPMNSVRIIAAGVAFFAAHTSSIPTTAVVGTDMYYNDQIAAGVRSAISAVNEAVVFDVPLAVEYARNFWSQRYNAAHNSCIYTGVNTDLDFFCTSTGVGFLFAAEDIKFLNENKKAVLAVVTELYRIKKEFTNAGA